MENNNLLNDNLGKGANSEKPNTPNKKISFFNDKNLGIFFILLSTFFFSLMSLFVNLAGDVPVFQKAFFRNLIASFISFFILLKSGSFKIQKGSMPGLIGRTLAGTIGVICNFYAISNMNISDATILNKLAPFFAIIFSIFILKEKTTLKDWLILIVAFIGAVFVAKPSLDFSKSIPSIAGVLGGLTGGLAYTFIRALSKKGERSSVIVFFFSIGSSLLLLPFAILTYEPMTLTQLVFLLLAGSFACLGQYSITKAYTYAPATEISIYDYAQVLFSAILGMIVLTQFPDVFSIIGYVIIISSAIIKYLLINKRKNTI